MRDRDGGSDPRALSDSRLHYHEDCAMSDEELTALDLTEEEVRHTHIVMTDEEHAALHAADIPHCHSRPCASRAEDAHDAPDRQGTTDCHKHAHENTQAVLNRLSRAIGHLQSVKRMVEDGRDCPDVLIQIAAVRAAIDNTGKIILQDHLRHCIVDAARNNDQAAIDDLCKAIEKYMK